MSTPTLFPELVHLIAASLLSIGGKQAIQPFALVCREWNSVSRPFLFQHIVIHGEDDIYDFLDILIYSSGIGQVVNDLTVKGGPVYGDCGVNFLELLASRVLVIMPALETLTLSGFTIDDFSPTTLPHLAQLRGVTTLKFRDITCSLPVLWGYMSSFPSLQAVDISGHSAHRRGERFDPKLLEDVNPSSNLISLRLDSCHRVDRFIERLKASNWAQSIHSLSLISGYWEASIMRDLLMSSPCLEELHLDVTSNSEIPTYIRLDTVPKLRVLTIKHYILDDNIKSFFANSRHENLRCLIFRLSDIDYDHHPRYRDIFGILNAERFPRLEEFQVVADSYWAPEDLMSELQPFVDFVKEDGVTVIRSSAVHIRLRLPDRRRRR